MTLNLPSTTLSDSKFTKYIYSYRITIFMGRIDIFSNYASPCIVPAVFCDIIDHYHGMFDNAS